MKTWFFFSTRKTFPLFFIILNNMTQRMNTQTKLSQEVKLKLYVHCRLSIHMIINTLIKKKQQNLKNQLQRIAKMLHVWPMRNDLQNSVIFYLSLSDLTSLQFKHIICLCSPWKHTKVNNNLFIHFTSSFLAHINY